MVKNIKDVVLWFDNPKSYNGVPLVKIIFDFPCSWTVLDINDLKKILKLWIDGEEIRYPKDQGFQGRDLLFTEIRKWFYEEDE